MYRICSVLQHVPKIFGFECAIDEHNAIGAPFVLMSFVPGNTAMDAGSGQDTYHDISSGLFNGNISTALSPCAMCHVPCVALMFVFVTFTSSLLYLFNS